MPRMIYFDTETTGTKPTRDKIIEIAAFDPDSGESFSELINPGIPIPPESTQIHNISDDMVKDASGFDVVGKSFIEFCGTDAVLVAHNGIGFDKPFLEEECKKASLIPHPWEYLDTLIFLRKYRPDLPRHSLQYLREYLEIPSNNAHRALDDVIMLHKVFTFFTDDLTVEDMLVMMKEKKKLRHMPFGKHKGLLLQDVPSSYVQWLNENGALDKEENNELKANFLTLGKIKS